MSRIPVRNSQPLMDMSCETGKEIIGITSGLKGPVPFWDAHNHLQDRRLDGVRGEFLAKLAERGIGGGVINGTCCDDWDAVAQLASSAKGRWVASYGVHPWRCRERPADWLEQLERRLTADPAAGVGEVGLDLWVDGADLEDQLRVFEPQLELAAALDRPLTIHCLRAWDPLLRILKERTMPSRGFLVHAFNGSAEIARDLMRMGARFSFSTSFAEPKRAKLREVYRGLPLDRLLVETDVPAMTPPGEWNLFPLEDGTGPVNHPLNLISAYRVLAGLRGMPVEQLAAVVAGNFEDLFAVG